MTRAEKIQDMVENLQCTGYTLAMLDLYDALEELEMKYGKDCPLIGEIKYDLSEMMGEKEQIRKVNGYNPVQSDFGE